MKLKIFGEVLVSQTGGSIIFHHVQAKFELVNFRLGPGQSDRVVNSSLTMSRLNLNLKIFGEILVSQMGS